ncbi:restriction endonuclease subunit S [Roseitranquillus sediminis]|uniref:restriction endonuclease subunit S n=1 Tax=Roseitranquillus sediminis TaxID=2809051 RepID=UPI001D0C0F80|nr:restriction endonuclease subunit S [Roseitranquillus sediminis]
MGDWNTRPLADFVDPDRSICYGIVQPGPAVSHGVPIVRVNNFVGGGVDTTGALKVDSLVEAKYRRSRLQGGELLITLVGSMGLSAIASEELRGWNVARAVGVVPLRPDADKRWINFVVRSKPTQDFIRMRANTTVQATFNLKDLAELPIPCPPDAIRTELSAILSALDDKIELNRRMNETLEAMARAMFKDWFVDFGPTRAKMGGHAPYLAPEIWSLFPDRLDADGKPEGWSVRPLDQVADFLNGLALQKYPANGGDALPVIKIAQLRAASVESADRASAEIPQGYIVEDGDVLFSWSGSLIHRVWTAGRGALNQHLFKVTSQKFPKWFFFHWITEHMPSFRATAASKATTMGHIQRRHLTQADTFIGTPAFMTAADELIAPLFNRQIANDLESRTLAATRDLLLPKLMSGEVRVKDAERHIGEAT